MIEGLTSPPFPEENDPGLLADWAELWALTHHSPLSLGKFRTTLSRESQLVETAAADAWSELERRAALISDSWPLKLQDGVLASVEGQAALFNYFMCALTFRYNIENSGRRIFEYCVTDAVRALTWNTALRIGAPREPHLPLDTVVDQYCTQALEEKGKQLPATDGDLGLDIAGWIRFPDNRGGYLHFVGQCATGQNWDEKLTELNPHKWRDHVGWAVPPVRFFATPFVIPENNFRRVSQDAGLILDRPRLLYLSTKAPLQPGTLKLVEEYCAQLY
jgi:hypothetical protein